VDNNAAPWGLPRQRSTQPSSLRERTHYFVVACCVGFRLPSGLCFSLHCPLPFFLPSLFFSFAVEGYSLLFFDRLIMMPRIAPLPSPQLPLSSTLPPSLCPCSLPVLSLPLGQQCCNCQPAENAGATKPLILIKNQKYEIHECGCCSVGLHCAQRNSRTRLPLLAMRSSLH
jgi:hypothetical protein